MIICAPSNSSKNGSDPLESDPLLKNISDLDLIRGEEGIKLEDEYDAIDDRVHWKQIFYIPSLFWWTLGSLMAYYGAVVPFFHICTAFFSYKWSVDATDAGLGMHIKI